MKKTSSRSQRGSRGIKGKHVLQICVLLGVCIWLIYQVKYSHDKKKEFYESDGKKLSEKEDGLVKLGRKDLLPGYHKNEKQVEENEDEDHGEEEKESKSKAENGTHEEEEEKEEDEVAEEDEEDKSKLGEEVVEDEEENKHEEDDIDEQDQSKTDGDADKDDEPIEEEKEKEIDHADEVDMTVDEAREEHYKADDASSAVSHESSRILNTEKLKESYDNSTGTAQENNSNATVSVVEVQKEPVLEKATTEVKDGDNESSTSEAKSVVTESRDETTVNGNSTEAVLEASGFLQNETKIMQERSQEDGAPPSGSSDVQTVVKLEQTGDESAPNITVSANITNIDSIVSANTTNIDSTQDESRNSTSESSVTENISGSNTTEVKEITRSEGDDDETGEYKESSNHFSTEQTEEADDTPESTMLQEEREELTDPQTLPDVRIEGNEEDEEEAISAE